jgi:hypothetical protein
LGPEQEGLGVMGDWSATLTLGLLQGCLSLARNHVTDPKSITQSRFVNTGRHSGTNQSSKRALAIMRQLKYRGLAFRCNFSHVSHRGLQPRVSASAFEASQNDKLAYTLSKQRQQESQCLNHAQYDAAQHRNHKGPKDNQQQHRQNRRPKWPRCTGPCSCAADIEGL